MVPPSIATGPTVPDRAQRRLAAILAIDMVGYSRRMEVDETGTIARLRQHRETIIDPTLGEHGGRIVKTMGDGLLVEFSSVVAALDGAVRIQRGIAAREAESRGARASSTAPASTWATSSSRATTSWATASTSRRGSRRSPSRAASSSPPASSSRWWASSTWPSTISASASVKNIRKPVRVYRVRLEIMPDGPDPAAGGATAAAKPSIAVLPFVDMSSDRDQEYFADGISEDIITELARNQAFFVTARNSTFTYKGRSVDVKQVAGELGVRYVLEGSVRRGGSRLQDHRPAHRRHHRQPCLGRALRPRARRRLRRAGRDRHQHRRRGGAATARRRVRARPPHRPGSHGRLGLRHAGQLARHAADPGEQPHRQGPRPPRRGARSFDGARPRRPCHVRHLGRALRLGA